MAPHQRAPAAPLNTPPRAGERKALCADSAADCSQLVRHLAERPAPTLPLWRQHRPALLVEHAAFAAQPAAPQAAGLLRLTGWVRGAGLSANQLVTVPGVGDFQIEHIEAAPLPQQAQHKGGRGGGGGGGGGAGGMETEAAGGDGGGGGGGGAGAGVVLARADEELREPLVRENPAGGEGEGEGEGEQTWPSAAEIKEAAQRAMFARRRARKKVPEGEPPAFPAMRLLFSICHAAVPLRSSRCARLRAVVAQARPSTRRPGWWMTTRWTTRRRRRTRARARKMRRGAPGRGPWRTTRRVKGTG